MHINYIKTFLGIKDENIKITNTFIEGHIIHIYLEFSQTHHHCPYCNTITSNVHDYRFRKIKHGYINGYFGLIHYRRRRYVCKKCLKRFPENNTFVLSYSKISILTKLLILEKSKQVVSFKTIAQDLNISSNTVTRHIDKHINPNRLSLPETISFDEFKKSNYGNSKYAFTMVDPLNKKIIDIIPNRRSDYLIRYFSKIPKSERYRVKNIIIDLWAPYKTIIKAFFPKAVIIADTFHFTRYIYWAFNDVRIRVMKQYKKYSIEYRILKKHWKILYKSPLDLSYKEKYHPLLRRPASDATIQDYAANLHPDMEEAMIIKDYYLSNLKSVEPLNANAFIDELINMLRNAKTKEFKEIQKTFINWKIEITNALTIKSDNDKRFTNGTIEGINNYIKVIKRLAYGYRNFNRFRNRIMFLFNKEYSIII